MDLSLPLSYTEFSFIYTFFLKVPPTLANLLVLILVVVRKALGLGVIRCGVFYVGIFYLQKNSFYKLSRLDVVVPVLLARLFIRIKKNYRTHVCIIRTSMRLFTLELMETTVFCFR